jgi:hypothetical protein
MYSLFRSVLRQRAAQYEVKNIEYAVLAGVIRDGGIKVATVARWSIIPNHSTLRISSDSSTV